MMLALNSPDSIRNLPCHNHCGEVLDLDNEPQPDVCLRIEPDVGGQSKISKDDYIEGAPELIVEIANTSAAYDLATKLEAYRRNGVQEYVVWQVHEQRIDWYQLYDNQYVPLQSTDGVICSRQFPGLWLAVEALLQRDMQQVLAIGQQGLSTAEHQQFLQTLQSNFIDEEVARFKMVKGWKTWVLGAITCLFVLFTACQSLHPIAQTSSSPPSPLPESSPSATPIISPPPTTLAPPPIVSGDRLMVDLNALNFERYTPAELQKSRDYITQTLTAAGWSVREQPFDTGVNVIAERPGTDPNAGTLLVGAHYDSVQGSPGADDNATGVVVALEVARLLGDRTTLRPLRVVFFDQEEAGLVGSYAYAKRRENLKNLDGVVILEMLGYTCATPGCQEKPVEFKVKLPSEKGDFLAIAGDTEHLPLLNAFSETHQPNLPALVSVPIPFKGLLTPVILRSDHTPFWFEGIGAVMVTDTAHLRNPHYHRCTDTPDTLDPAFLEGNAQTVVNAVTVLLDRSQSFMTAATGKS